MAAKRKPRSFEPERQPKAGVKPAAAAKPQPVAQGQPAAKARPGAKAKAQAKGSQVIPPVVANRMARRIGVATGVPSVLGMGVFVASYLLVSRGILDIPPVVTLASSGGLFLLGVLGLSYGVLSSSWEPAPGTLLGMEQIGMNIGRMRASIRAIRQGGGAGG
jgi:hypothetical protein